MQTKSTYPTRSEIYKNMKQEQDYIIELSKYLNGESVPRLVEKTLREKLNEHKAQYDSLRDQLSQYTAKCMFCKTKVETEELTRVFICKKCDNKISGIK